MMWANRLRVGSHLLSVFWAPLHTLWWWCKSLDTYYNY